MTKAIPAFKHRPVGKRKGVGNAFKPAKVQKSRKGNKWLKISKEQKEKAVDKEFKVTIGDLLK